jgi:glyoxalase family protein
LKVLVKTVDFDEPSVLQLYCGQNFGEHGSVVSFLQRPRDPPAIHGLGQVGNIAYTIESGSHDFWKSRLIERGVKPEGDAWSFGERHLCFTDPDGVRLSLVERRAPHLRSRPGAPTAVGRIHSIEMEVANLAEMSRVVSGVLSYNQADRDGVSTRFASRSSGGGEAVILVNAPGFRPALAGRGAVRHIAWRVANLKALLLLREKIAEEGYDIGPPVDRQFFHACYFAGPEGFQFAIATDGPGFAQATLQQTGEDDLSLPPWLEARRAEIRNGLLMSDISKGRS